MWTCFLAEYFLLQHNYRHVSQITITRVLCFVLFSFLPSQKINLFSTEFNKDWTKIYYFFYCFPIGQNWTIGQSIFKLRYFFVTKKRLFLVIKMMQLGQVTLWKSRQLLHLVTYSKLHDFSQIKSLILLLEKQE